MKFPLMPLAAVAAAHAAGHAPAITVAAPSASSAAYATPVARVLASTSRMADPTPTTSTVVKALSVVPAFGKASVLVDVDPSVEIQDFTLDSPYRIVVDLKGATLVKPAPTYDKVARGGIVNVRVSQFRANVVRVVLELDRQHTYEVKRGDKQLQVTVNGTTADFAAWHSAGADAGASTPSTTASVAPAAQTSSAVTPPAATTRSTTTSHGASTNNASTNTTPSAPQTVAQELAENTPVTHQANKAPVRNSDDQDDDRPMQSSMRRYAPGLTPASMQSRQPRITINYQDADIRDVIAAFAAFSGRTIVVGKDVEGTVTAEIHNQPWDVALRAILSGQGLAASEDAVSGIISVDSYANIQAKQALEPLVTQLIPLNYAKADSLVPVITKLLAKDCTAAAQGAGASAAGSASSTTNCYVRGAVASNPGTNTLIVTETPSRIGDIISYVQNLDIRTPQVAIKAKIIFVDRTDIENLGVSYDLGSKTQFFSQLVKRIDPSTLKPIDTNGDGVPDALGGGTPYTSDQIALGGNTISAIANANNRVADPALSLVYSAALGKFSLTSFIDALQEVKLADLQAEPSIVTVDNKEAQIQVGQDIPVRVLDASTAEASGASGTAVPRATVSFKPVGIILKVTPHITNNRQILLDVHAENSSAEIASSDIGYVFNKQSADNQLLVVDGETAVIGGLTVTQVSNDRTGIPILSDLPILGRLFSTSAKSEEKRDLLILITPHIIDEGERTTARGH
jgi:type IV pilus assembly protein PilQ